MPFTFFYVFIDIYFKGDVYIFWSFVIFKVKLLVGIGLQA